MTPPTRKPSKFRSWKRFFSILFVVLLIGVVSATLWFVVLSFQLNSELNRLRTAGWPTNRQEIETFNRVQEGAVDSTQLWLDVIGTVLEAGLSDPGKNLPVYYERRPIFPPWDAPFPELDEARELVSTLKPQLTAIHKARAAGGQVRFSSDVTPLTSPIIRGSRSLRDVSRLLSLDAHVAARDGDCDRAFEDVSTALSLPLLLRHDCDTTSQLSRVGILAYGVQLLQEILPACAWNDERLESLQVRLLGDNFTESMICSLRGELATDLSLADALPLPLRILNQRKILRDTSYALEKLSLPLHEAIPILRAFDENLKNARESRIALTSFHVSGLFSLYANSVARSTARQRCAIVALGMYRHRLRHGNFPSSLNLIDKSALGVESTSDPDLLLDPFNGQPLRFREQESLILIYSVGDDLQDDGGDICIGQCIGTKDTGIAVMNNVE